MPSASVWPTALKWRLLLKQQHYHWLMVVFKHSGSCSDVLPAEGDEKIRWLGTFSWHFSPSSANSVLCCQAWRSTTLPHQIFSYQCILPGHTAEVAIVQALDWIYSFTFTFLLNNDSAIRESGTYLKILTGGPNTDTSEYLKVDITGFKDKSQSLSSLSYQYVGSPRGLHRHARLS